VQHDDEQKLYTNFWYKNLEHLTHIGEEGRIISVGYEWMKLAWTIVQ
jgi:hypothetical protein